VRIKNAQLFPRRNVPRKPASSKEAIMGNKTKSWRDGMPVHPAAELFPLLSPEELAALAKDIRGGPDGFDRMNPNLLSLPVLYEDLQSGECWLIDGRNRLDAMELLGWRARFEKGAKAGAKRFESEVWHLKISKGPVTFYRQPVVVLHPCDGDPYGLVLSFNIHRRHLKPEKKRELIAELLKADPAKSNRQIADQVKVSHPHVAKVRAELEKTGDVETVTTSIDTRGRRQPKHKPKPVDPQVSADRRKTEAQTDLEDFTPKGAMNGSVPKPTETWTGDQLDRKRAALSGRCVVANMHDDAALIAWAKDTCRFVLIDRKTDWGNYFKEGEDGTHDEVVAKYAKFCLPNKNGLLRKLPNLRGMVLGCWCHPKRCHGHIIAEAVNFQPPAAAEPQPGAAEAAE
jgi:DNA-binding Lrp family transcriptional regulator